MWRIGTGAQRLSDNFDPLKEFMVCIQNARRRAKKLQIDCELTDEFSKAIWLRCQGSCEVTGIQFNFNWNFGSSSRRPFAPSIDRIDSRFGYTEGNVRVVCVAVNLAMNDWGESVLQIIAKALVNKNSLKIKKDTQP